MFVVNPTTPGKLVRRKCARRLSVEHSSSMFGHPCRNRTQDILLAKQASALRYLGVLAKDFASLCKQDSLAEWSKALASGASPQGRGFEPHSCHCHVPLKGHLCVDCQQGHTRACRMKNEVSKPKFTKMTAEWRSG